MAKNYKYFLLARLSGLILSLAYPGWSFDIGFLAWLGFIPLIFALEGIASSTGKLKRFFLVGFSAGIVYFLIIFRWFWSFYPLDTLGIKSGIASAAIIFALYAITSVAMAAFWGFFGLTFGFFRKRNPKQTNRWGWLIAPAIFIFLEYARAAGYGLLWLGSGTVFGAHWTMGNLAYSLAGNPVILKLASYIGIYGITFLIIAVNFLAFKTVKTGGNKYRIMMAVGLLAIILVPLVPRKAAETGKKVAFAIVQTNLPTRISYSPQETLVSFKQQLDLLSQVSKNHPESQLIVFPEASDFFKDMSGILSGKQVQTYFGNLFKDPRLIISGARIIAPDSTAYSRVFSLDTKQDIIGYYDKKLLTPGGEFLPYSVQLLADLLSKVTVSHFGNVRNLAVGKKPVSTINFDGKIRVAPIICSELLSPILTRSVTQGADIIAGMASYGIFHGKNIFSRQNLASVRFRAAENRKPILMAANMGQSYAVDGSGQVQMLAHDQSPQILTGNVVLSSGKSWYNKVGDLPIFLASLLLITSFIFLTRPENAEEV